MQQTEAQHHQKAVETCSQLVTIESTRPMSFARMRILHAAKERPRISNNLCSYKQHQVNSATEGVEETEENTPGDRQCLSQVPQKQHLTSMVLAVWTSQSW
jgi:hypothetical protein